MDVFANGIVCSADRLGSETCGSSLKFVYTFLSVIGLLLEIFLCFLYNSMMIDINPFSKVAFASATTSCTETKFFLKFALVLYFAIDYSASIQITLSVILTAIYFVILVQIYF